MLVQESKIMLPTLQELYLLLFHAFLHTPKVKIITFLENVI